MKQIYEFLPSCWLSCEIVNYNCVFRLIFHFPLPKQSDNLKYIFIRFNVEQAENLIIVKYCLLPF